MADPICTAEQIQDICDTEQLLADPIIWQQWVDSNSSDSYGMGIMTYASRWVRCMQYAMNTDGYALEDVAQQLSYDIDFEGITGFMYGALPLKCWQVAGNTEKQFRQWHNAQYGVTDADGVVNPVILSMN